MNSYNPDLSPVAKEWLETDEGERIALVSAYHQDNKITLANAPLHAVMHVIVENQLALDEEGVINTLTRLQREGLSRHDALHAIGSVLAENVYELLREQDSNSEAYQKYLAQLRKLTAQSWRMGQ
jgi:hypothetical protein